MAATVTSPSSIFDVTTIYVPAGQPVTITYRNGHRGVPHNFHVTGNGVDVMTALTSGPDAQTLTVALPTDGDYTYLCDTHPVTMTGVMIAV